MSQDVLRFMFVSPPKKPVVSVRLGVELSGIGSALLGLSQGTDAQARAVGFARSFLDGTGFAGEPSDLPLSSMFRDVAERISSLDRFSAAGLQAAIRTAAGESASEVAAAPAFRSQMQRLADGILALTLAPEGRPTLLEEYVQMFRVGDLIMKVAQSADQLDGVRYRNWRRIPVELPAGLFPLQRKAQSVSTTTPTGSGNAAASVGGLTARLIDLDDATEELLAIGADDLRVESDAIQDPGNARALATIGSRVEHLEQSVRDLAARTDRDKSTLSSGTPLDGAASASLLATAPARARLLVKPDVLKRLTSATKATLATLDLDPERTALASVVERVALESERVRRDLERISPQPEKPATIRVGNTTIATSLFSAPTAPDAADDFTAPDAGGELAQFAIGSLLLTSMQIESYQAGEVGHIENVLVGETKERETRRLRRTEETTVREIETTKEEERDLQSAERLEMQREVQNTVKESQQFRIGGSLSASYGPFVQATVSTEFATDSSSEDVARNASNYAREIVERTASKITERIREEQTVRVIQEYEERNLHRLDGSARDQHIVGIFQWVDKVYQAQVFDYGVRLICRLYVPDPARFLQQAVLQSQAEQEGAISPPDPVNFGPLSITPSNYDSKVKKYRAKGVSPPPEPIITLSVTFKKQEPAPAPEGEGGDEDEQVAEKETSFTEVREQAIPSGYRAVEAYVAATSVDANAAKGGIPYGVVVHVGRRVFPFVNPDTEGSVIKGDLTDPLSDEVGSLPIVLVAENVTQYVAAVEIKCHRTTTALRRWQLQTYEAILDAHQAQEAEYRERLAEAAAQAGVVVEGRNPEQNRQIERGELKRLALSMITRQHFGGFGAYKTTVPIPQIDFDKAFEQGRFIRFCSETFEWENMSFELLDYFWTNKNRWAKKLLTADTDPLHAAFHAAGAAKVEIPLRPDYEAAFFYYRNTGKIWEGGGLPPVITSAQSALLAQVLDRREGEDPHQRIPLGEPWEVRLPTTLVRVSPSSELPRWEQDESGTWQPVNPG